MKSTFEIQKQLFLEAFAIIKDESKWCKNYGAINANGERVRANDPNACKWCSTGVMQKVDDDFIALHGYIEKGFPITQFREFTIQNRNSGIITYNDRVDTTHKDIVTLWEAFGKSQNYL